MQKLKSIQPIGRGGFGNVDLVEDDSGQRFARKTFAENQPLSPELLENVKKRFSKEVRIQESIRHQNIVPVIGKDLTEDPPFYLMPLAESCLYDDIEKDRTLGGNFVSVLSDIIAGLEELHSMEIYHRDLKPGNVLRFASSNTINRSFYAISDFGLISMKETKLSRLTETGMGKGSDNYTAAEIHNDLKKASVFSDIYSLGCILHDMVGTEPRTPFHEIREPGDFASILLGCTRKEPNQRFKSARAVLDAILTVNFVPKAVGSRESVGFIEVLEGNAKPTENYWSDIAEFLDYEASTDDVAAICGRINVDHIDILCSEDKFTANRLAIYLAQWVARTGFDFDFCDIIADRLEKFFEQTSFEAKVECLMALLELGTSHNRWFVERKFMRLCGQDMDNNLAKRLAMQFRILGDDVCRSIEHLETSIRVSRTSLHPVLIGTLSELCP